MNSALAARRWFVILAAALSGLLVLVSMFIDPAPAADGKELIKGYSENLDASGVHTNPIHYGFALFAPVAYAIVGLVRGRGAWIANLAGICAVLGLSTLPGLVLLDFTNVAAALETDLDTAHAISVRLDELTWFLVLVIPAFLSVILAMPLAAIAGWRAGLFGWWVPLATIVSGVAPNMLDWYIGFPIMAIAMLILAHGLWRIPRDVWYPGTGAERSIVV